MFGVEHELRHCTARFIWGGLVIVSGQFAGLFWSFHDFEMQVIFSGLVAVQVQAMGLGLSVSQQKTWLGPQVMQAMVRKWSSNQTWAPYDKTWAPDPKRIGRALTLPFSHLQGQVNLRPASRCSLKGSPSGRALMSCSTWALHSLSFNIFSIGRIVSYRKREREDRIHIAMDPIDWELLSPCLRLSFACLSHCQSHWIRIEDVSQWASLLCIERDPSWEPRSLLSHSWKGSHR